MTGSLLKKKPDASIFKINGENFSTAKIDEMIGGRALFENKYIVVLSSLLDIKEQKEYLLEKINEIKKSDNIFFWIEEKVNLPDLKKIQSNSEKVISFIKESENENKSKEIFKLTEYFVNKDKKNAWLSYQKVIKNTTPEEIYGMLWWQVKTLILVSKSRNAEEAGLKNFVYQKNRKILEKYKEGELFELAEKLISAYHNSRSDSEDLVINLERLILE